MRFHALRFSEPIESCTTFATCIQSALDAPLLREEPVADDGGMVYAMDLVTTDGFYLFFLSLVLWNTLRGSVLEHRDE